MSTLTSEQAITALEHSSKPTVELLDDTATILSLPKWGLIYETGLGNSLSLGSDGVKFREQWILRWIIKRLNQSIDVKHTTADQSWELLSDLRTWALLRCLLDSIPKHISKDILLERNFCRILSECLATVNRSKEPKVFVDEDASVSDQSYQNDGRPSKRRKISPDRSASTENSTTQTKFLLLTNLFHVVKQTAETLSVRDNKDLVHRTCVTSNWADSVDEAAKFIARVTNTACLVLPNLLGRAQQEERVIEEVADTLHQWIELWQTNAKAALNQPKHDPCAAFTNHALVPALNFLVEGSVESTKTVCQAFERQIALCSLLPLRSTFQKRFASAWNSWKTEPQMKTVQPVLEALKAGLGAAAVSFGAPESESRAVALIGITSRLIPRSDVIKRKAERSWIEALFLCLSSQPSASVSNNSAWHALSTPLPVEEKPSTFVNVSSTLLDALQGADIEPSTNLWRFYIRHALSGAAQDVSLKTLAKIVNLSASAFVPENRETDPSSLNTLCVVLANSLNSDDASLEAALNDVIAPVVEEFGRIRRLEAFIEFWVLKLTDAFHDRTATTAQHSYNALWDHPTMVEIFSSVCQRLASPSLCIDLLKTVLEDLAGLAEVIGPTHEQFGRITVVSSMLGPLGKSPTVQAMFNTQDRSILDLIHDALLRSTDYQGHRWRLWKLLELCMILFPGGPESKDLHSLGPTSPSSPFTILKDFELQKAQPNSKYLEGYQWFSFVISSHEKLKDDNGLTLTEAVGALNDMIQICLQHTASKKVTSDSWNGVVGTMDSLFRMVSTCLARLARSSTAWSSTENMPEDFLTNLASLTFSQDEAGSFSCLAIAAEAMLTRITTSTKMSLTDVYIDPLSKSVTADTVPGLLSSAIQEMASEHQTQEVIEALCKVMEETNLKSHEAFTDCLCLINKSLLSLSGSAFCASESISYAKLLERSTFGAELEYLAAAYQFIQQTTRLLFAQSDINWRSERGSALERLLQVTQEHLIEADASEEFKVLDTYTGYLSLMVGRIVHDLDVTSTTKTVRKAVDKIKKHHGPVVLKQCTLYLNESSSVIDFWLVFVLLDSLVRPSDDKAFNKKLQKCLQSLVQAILAIDTRKSEGITSIQEAGIIAKLWYILSKYMKTTRSKQLPPFPHPSFVRRLGKDESANTLEMQAQLATSHPSQDSILSLARLAKLTGVGEELPTSDDASDAGPKPFLSIAAKIRSLVLNDVSTDARTIEVLGHIAYLQTANNEISLASLIARLELSKMVLEKHPLVVNQHVIDSTLKSTTLLASSASKATITTDAAQLKPEHIFDRLCAILSILLVRYRRRLAGRYHLFLPVIQNLLKCLFYPSSRKHLTISPSASKLTYLASLPPWLNPPTHTNTQTLPAPSATKLSRILQQLCDPSASSARHVSKRTSTPNDNLVDEVKTLRREVSQHTQYLLQTYCQVMLDGSIESDVREKLLPGLYAVMNATDVEVMRGLNAALDGSQRAIWRDLYAEWKSYGRWNQR